MTTREQVEVLAGLVTRDEAGRHFTERWPWATLRDLEEAGLIEIERPVHKATGIPYSQEYWSVRVTPEGHDLVGSCPGYWPEEATS